MIPENTNIPDNPKIRGWVLYDGHCGFCSAGARQTASLMRRLGFAITPLQTPWVAARLGNDLAHIPQEMALLTRDGLLLEGVDAYLYIAGQMWWARPFAFLAKVRWVDQLLRWMYRWIAAHRRQISAACRLQPDLPESGRGR